MTNPLANTILLFTEFFIARDHTIFPDAASRAVTPALPHPSSSDVPTYTIPFSTTGVQNRTLPDNCVSHFAPARDIFSFAEVPYRIVESSRPFASALIVRKVAGASPIPPIQGGTEHMNAVFPRLWK